jgi:membrane-associated phospholipid phosphatase
VDTVLFRWVNNLAKHTTWAHAIVKAFAVYGIAVFVVLLLTAWWRARSSEDPATSVVAVAWAAIAPLIGFVAVQVIGSIVDRSRPYDAITNVLVLVDRTKDSSFPSDHATAAGAVAAGLWLVGRQLGSHRQARIAIGAAMVLAFSRVYVGAHYPGDVLAGLALGTLVAVAGAPLAQVVLHPIARWAARTPARPLIMRRRRPGPMGRKRVRSLVDRT